VDFGINQLLPEFDMAFAFNLFSFLAVAYIIIVLLIRRINKTWLYAPLVQSVILFAASRLGARFYPPFRNNLNLFIEQIANPSLAIYEEVMRSRRPVLFVAWICGWCLIAPIISFVCHYLKQKRRHKSSE